MFDRRFYRLRPLAPDRATRTRHGAGRKPRFRGWGVRKGASVVEFAIVAPFLFALLLGMMEFGRMLMVHHVLTTAARTGAREAVLPGATAETVEAAALEVASASAIPVAGLHICCSSDPSTTIPGSTIQVTVAVPIAAISTLGKTWFGENHEVSSTSAMRKEGFE